MLYASAHLRRTFEILAVIGRFPFRASGKSLAIVKVVDAETNRVIRQIPSEEAVLVAKKISRMMGILYDTSA